MSVRVNDRIIANVNSNKLIGDLTKLATKNKGNLVEAINEMVEDTAYSKTPVFTSIEYAKKYAEENQQSYTGQQLIVIDPETNDITIYIIANDEKRIEKVGSSGNLVDYRTLVNKPSINNIVLDGNKSSEDILVETVSLSNSDIEAIFNL